MQCASSMTKRARLPYAINRGDFGHVGVKRVEEVLESGIENEQLGREIQEFEAGLRVDGIRL